MGTLTVHEANFLADIETEIDRLELEEEEERGREHPAIDRLEALAHKIMALYPDHRGP